MTAIYMHKSSLMITLFLQVANKLLELHVHLKDLGHPKYLNSVETRTFECKTHSDNADGEVLHK